VAPPSLGAEDDAVDADRPALSRVGEVHAEERRLDRRVLLAERAAAVVARHDGAELAHHPDVVGVGVRDRVQVHVARVDAGVRARSRQLHLGPDAHHGPGAAAVLGCGSWCEVARPCPAGVGELEAEEMAATSRSRSLQVAPPVAVP